MNDTCHLYTDLAWLWPLWGDADEYAHYCRHVASLIEQHAERPAGTLLDIGCGGGRNVLNLKGTFRVTGVDLSPTMLAQARNLNPESTFVHGDMRTFRLGRTFDQRFQGRKFLARLMLGNRAVRDARDIAQGHGVGRAW